MRINPDQMAAKANQASELLKQMANPNRLQILCCLVEGEQSVGALNAGIALSQSSLSQHLASLRQAGLVATRRQAQTIYYRLADPRAKALLERLYALYCGPE